MTEEELVKSWLRLCRDPRTPNEMLEKACYWESISRPAELDIRLAAARNRSASSELLANLANINNLKLQISVAGHPNLSESTAGKLMKTQLRELRRALASNPRIPLYVMKKLARDFEDVRSRLARNPGIPVSIMVDMTKEKSILVRRSLASNPNLHGKILEFLSQDKDADVRKAIAMHDKIPSAGLAAMASDPVTSVREAVFEMALKHFPHESKIFETLAGFSDGLVADRARSHLKTLNEQPEPVQTPNEAAN
ncbi:MAG: hypothetical protein KDC71_01555 [Acidobacteria bacterium]|nr:hypothetical protein [Acidobacteriota bacterium]